MAHPQIGTLAARTLGWATATTSRGQPITLPYLRLTYLFGGSLKNLVTMTVFITDVRNGDRFVEIRKEMFPDGNFPGSALITITGLARPGMLIEIQGIGVIGDNCSNEKPCSKK